MTLQLDKSVTADMTDIDVRAVLSQIFASTQVEYDGARTVSFNGPSGEYWQLDRELMLYVDTLCGGQNPRQFHRSSANVDFCLEDSLSGLFLSRLMFQSDNNDWVLIHVDDHADMMPSALIRHRDGRLFDPGADRYFDCCTEEHWLESITSGTVNIGNYLTPLLNQIEGKFSCHIRHLRPALTHGEADRLYSVGVTGDSHPIFGEQKFAALSINSHTPSTSTYLQSTDPRQCCSDLPSGKFAVHIDLDFFVNDFNGNPGNAPRSLSRVDRNSILESMDDVFEQIEQSAQSVDRWIVATSPGFCAARHWPWLLQSLGKRIQTVSGNQTMELPWMH